MTHTAPNQFCTRRWCHPWTQCHASSRPPNRCQPSGQCCPTWHTRRQDTSHIADTATGNSTATSGAETTLHTPTSMLQWIMLDTTSWHQHSHHWWLSTSSQHRHTASTATGDDDDNAPPTRCLSIPILHCWCGAFLLCDYTWCSPSILCITLDAAFYLHGTTSWKIPSYIYYLHFIPGPSFSLLCNKGAVFSYLLFCSSLHSHSCAMKTHWSCLSSSNLS